MRINDAAADDVALQLGSSQVWFVFHFPLRGGAYMYAWLIPHCHLHDIYLGPIYHYYLFAQ